MLFPYVLDVKNSIETDVGAGAATSTVVMTAHKVYAFASTTNCWIKQDKAANIPVASAASGSAFVPANIMVVLDGSFGDTISVIRDTASGKCSVTPCMQTR